MKNRNLVFVMAALAATAVAAPATAQSPGFRPGFYIGAGLGQSRISGDQSGSVRGVPYSTTGFDDSETTGQINGGYQFTEVWGVELQYTDLGSRSGTVTSRGTTVRTPDIKAYQWGISGTGTYMFAPTWFLRGKLGVSSNHIDNTDVNVRGTTFEIGGSDKTDVLAGLAIGHKWTENFSSRLEYEYFGKFEGRNGNSSNGSISNIGLRMQYKF
ncbi:outer membrane protein [Noviherbaspirillum pedocola]|uniref:Porin family protein n=1 Tax=Noviherbaspirillum pedocola TaxID=2801341 RepID=A0A934SSK0_9BURK|nr:outer membrane beta-barrel protein [Noviherbaspirillum pedocola]MBK4734406.1 porin family protein [Noviherbaspirillum pedocola]